MPLRLPAVSDDKAIMRVWREIPAKLSLTTRFYLAAGVIITLMATAFAWSGSRYVTDQTLLNAAKQAAAQAEELQAEYGSKLTSERWRRLLKRWRDNNFVVAKIWSPDGVIQYSSEPKLMGRRFPIEDDLEEALKGELVYGVTGLKKEENVLERTHGELLEIYAPIKTGGRVVAVHELYLSALPLRREIARLSLVIWSASFSAFALLFLILSGIVRSASRKIRTQQRSLEKALSDLSDHYLATIESFNLALQSRDNYTARHSERVADLAVKIGQELELGEDSLEALRIGALFHDIGKIGISDDILLKPASLAASEFGQVKLHPITGYEILAPLASMSASLAVVRHHHERWDGSGYPDGLKGDAIDITAQVASFADICDALMSERPYRAAMSHEDAMATMAGLVGSHFDPVLASKVLRFLNEQADAKESRGASAPVPSGMPEPAIGR